ncbi:MAG: N-formylglutamate amidohydrolase [Micavibrio sp.]|nr:N-formylglutamate amidohydrolase [Micavibrio sp.]
MAAHILHVDAPPGSRSCLVADSPHSGTQYPADFNYACDFHELKKAEDTAIDRLFGFFPALGAPFLQADFPRAYVDPNRKDTVTQKLAQEGDQPYVGSETGLVRRKCTPRSSQHVYDRTLSLSEVFNRVAACHKPYHDKLAQLLDETVREKGRVVHVNCHSMPSTLQRGTKQNPFDVIIGTYDGATCDAAIAKKLQQLFTAHGYKCAIDVPGYRGAEIITRHGDPAHHRHSLQLEINRALYMNEDTLVLKPEAVTVKAGLQSIMADFAAWCDAQPGLQSTATPKPPKSAR